HARLEPGDLPGDEPVAPADLLVRGDAQADHVDLAPGVPHEVVEPLPEQRARPVQTGRVDEDELRVRPVQYPADHVPGGLRLGRGDRDLLPDQRVGQRRLAGVRPADETGEPGPEGTHAWAAYRRPRRY